MEVIYIMLKKDMPKLLSLIRSHLFISTFVPLALGDRSTKKSLLRYMSKSVLHMFSFRSFMVSGLILSLFLYTV